MNFELSQEEGEFLVRLARDAIKLRLDRGEAPKTGNFPAKLKTPCGVFVTLNKLIGESHHLRGCIGFPYPVKSLIDALMDVAVSSALNDPRFEPITLRELSRITVEVSVLTPPEVIKVERPYYYPEKIQIGRDGLIVSQGAKKGLLLPQVPIEWSWDSEEFLTHCCLKAQLPPDAWLHPDTEVSIFRAIIFAEEEPMGAIKRIKLQER